MNDDQQRLIDEYLNQELLILKKQQTVLNTLGLKIKKPAAKRKKTTTPGDDERQDEDSYSETATDETTTASDGSSSIETAVEPPSLDSLLPASFDRSLLSYFTDGFHLPGDFPLDEPKKYREISISTLGMTPVDFTGTGLPQVTSAVLKKLAGKNVFSEGNCSLSLVFFFGSHSD